MSVINSYTLQGCKCFPELNGRYEREGNRFHFFSSKTQKDYLIQKVQSSWKIGIVDQTKKFNCGLFCESSLEESPPTTGWLSIHVHCDTKLIRLIENVESSGILSNVISTVTGRNTESKQLRELRERLHGYEYSNEALTREVDMFKKDTKELKVLLLDRDTEVDQLQTVLKASEIRLMEVLKARGFHDTRATLDSNFPSAIEMVRDMQTIADQTLKNLVDCWRTYFKLHPATLALILDDLFAKCKDFIDQKFQQFNVEKLIRMSIEQRLTLEQSLRGFRISLFGLSKFDDTEECKHAFGELLGLDWISWAQNFTDDEVRRDVERWYIDIGLQTLKFELYRRLCGSTISADWSSVGNALAPGTQFKNICKSRERESSLMVIFPFVECSSPEYKYLPAYVIDFTPNHNDGFHTYSIPMTTQQLWSSIIPFAVMVPPEYSSMENDL